MTRTEAIKILSHRHGLPITWTMQDGFVESVDTAIEALNLQGVIHCKDCRWWEKNEYCSSYGYCHAIKHSYYSRHWEINIHRTYEEDFYCADAELRTEEEEEQDE